jgi:hypothetical protein
LVIDRLVTGLRELATLPPVELDTEAGKRLLGDCADAVRLELDCPQQSLTVDQRTALSRLSDALEESSTSSGGIVAAARAAYATLVR